MKEPPRERPLLVALAGPNGAGKSTFYQSHLRLLGVPFVNADELAGKLNLDPYEAAALAAQLRKRLVVERQSFIFETVLSDPVGEKVSFLKEAANAGYEVTLIYIGLSNWEESDARVAMRVSQGGHDVPPDKLKARFDRIVRNLGAAIRTLPKVEVFDNSDLRTPFLKVAEYASGRMIYSKSPLPEWLRSAME